VIGADRAGIRSPSSDGLETSTPGLVSKSTSGKSLHPDTFDRSPVALLITAQDVYMRGYQLVVPADCVASRRPADTVSALAHIRRVLSADIAPSASLKLARLLRSAGRAGWSGPYRPAPQSHRVVDGIFRPSSGSVISAQGRVGGCLSPHISARREDKTLSKPSAAVRKGWKGRRISSATNPGTVDANFQMWKDWVHRNRSEFSSNTEP